MDDITTLDTTKIGRKATVSLLKTGENTYRIRTENQRQVSITPVIYGLQQAIQQYKDECNSWQLLQDIKDGKA